MPLWTLSSLLLRNWIMIPFEGTQMILSGIVLGCDSIVQSMVRIDFNGTSGVMVVE